MYFIYVNYKLHCTTRSRFLARNLFRRLSEDVFSDKFVTVDFYNTEKCCLFKDCFYNL